MAEKRRQARVANKEKKKLEKKRDLARKRQTKYREKVQKVVGKEGYNILRTAEQQETRRRKKAKKEAAAEAAREEASEALVPPGRCE